ncbi:MAG: hypothetical protein LC799_22245 [Actinobacteria bacterium]|nr:hypothetical protein [Actinomycetota bacterium]
MSMHAFVDESCRARAYLLTVALVDPADLVRLRRLLRGLLLPGQRELHCKKETLPGVARSLPSSSQRGCRLGYTCALGSIGKRLGKTA